MTFSGRFRLNVLLILAISVFLLWHLRASWLSNYERSISQLLRSASLGKASNQADNNSTGNRTLGFQAIIALSGNTIWRQEGMRAAANLTGLQITYPVKPPWHQNFVKAFEKIGSDNGAVLPNRGSALAWLAHIDVLKFVIQSGFSTALILEDDVDWDVSVKDQMQRVSQAVRNFTLADATDDSPYGSNWDLLWLGHCADGSPGSAPSLAFDDPSAVPHESFKGWSTGIVKEIEEGQRAVFASIYPVCTFAYAVTAKSASTILDFVGEGQDFAFDLKMNRGCGKHRYRCITVSPELMRHFKPDEQYGTSSEIAQQNGEGTESRLSTQSAADVRGTTENIRNSARCKAIFDEECFVA